MAQETKLSIAVKTDLKDGRSLLKFLNDLSALGNKTAKALQGINLGSAGPGAQKGGLAKALLEQKSLFNDLGQAGEKLSRVLTNVVGRSTEELDRKLERVNKRLQKAVEISEKFRALADKGGGGRGSAATGRANAADDLVQSLSVQYENLASARSALGSSASKLNMRALLSQIPGMGWLGMVGGAAGGIYGAYRLGGMAKNAWAGYQEGMLDLSARPAQIAAERGRAVGSYQIGEMTGNLSQAYFASQADHDANRNEYIQRKADIAARENGFFNNEINPIKWWSRLKNKDAAVAAAKDASGYEYLQLKSDANQTTKFGIDWLQQNAPRLVSGTRRTGMKNFGINPWGRAGITESDLDAIRLGLVSSGGRSALSLEGSVVSAVRGGMDTGTATSLAGAGSIAGDLLKALPGGLDPTAKEALGQAVASFLGPQNIIGSMSGLVATLGSGVGGTGAEQRRTIAQNLMGMQAGQALFSGSDAWQKTVNLADAVSGLPNGSLYAQNKLANLPFSTLISLANAPEGKMKLPGYWSGVGITEDSVRHQLHSTLSRPLARFIDQGKDDEASRLARHIRDSYGSDLRKWARSSDYTPHKGEVAAGLLSEVDPNLGGETQVFGFINDLRGKPGRAAKGGGGSRDAAEGTTPADALSAQIEKLNKAVSDILTPVTDLGKAAKQAAADLRGPKDAGLTNIITGPWTGLGPYGSR